MAAVLVGVSLVGSLVLWQGVAALRRYEAARNVTRSAIDVPKTWVGLWITVGTDNVLGSLTAVVGMPGDAHGGHLVSIPTNGDGSGQDAARSFRRAFADGGVDELQFAVEAALNVTFDFIQVSTPADFVALLSPASPTEVTLASPVDSATPPLRAGTASLSGEQVAQVLNRRDHEGDEPSRSANILAVGKGVAAAIGTGKTTAAAGAPPTTFAELLNHVMAGPVDSAAVSTRPLEAERVHSGADVALIDVTSAVMIFAAVAPSNVSAPSTGLIYRVEAPPGSEQRMYDAVATLLYVGFNVTQISLAGPQLETTRVFLADSRDRETTAEEDPLFGAVDYSADGPRILGIDVVLSLGANYLSQSPKGMGVATSVPPPNSSTTTSAPAEPNDSVVPTGTDG